MKRIVLSESSNPVRKVWGVAVVLAALVAAALLLFQTSAEGQGVVPQTAGPLGFTKGQMARVAVMNPGVSPIDVTVEIWGSTQLADQTLSLDPQQRGVLNLAFKNVPHNYVDNFGRAEVRAVAFSEQNPSLPMTLEVVAKESGKTQVALQGMLPPGTF